MIDHYAANPSSTLSVVSNSTISPTMPDTRLQAGVAKIPDGCAPFPNSSQTDDVTTVTVNLIKSLVRLIPLTLPWILA